MIELEYGNKILKTLTMLNERQKRLYLAQEAVYFGYGGIVAISNLTGVSRTTITNGIEELEAAETLASDRIRKEGGGRKAIKETNPDVVNEIQKIVETQTYGNPENPLSYTTKSLRKIEAELKSKGYKIGYDTIGKILVELGYSLQLNQKMLQVNEAHPNRDEQFKFINDNSKEASETGMPVISIDAKKKEYIGNFKNEGKTYNKKGNPTKVFDHDFPLEELGKVTPYGVYDINKNEGFVNLGISKDTAEFAVESISRWWLTVGKNTYPGATMIYVVCDGGGSNGSRNRLWKYQLQQFANQSGLEVQVSHLPPGTSKWNKIEHRLFCYISSHWRGQPLVSVEAVIDLIGSTTTNKGLKVICKKDDNTYEIGKKISDEEFNKINLKGMEKFPNWNYIISPQ